MQTGCYRTHEFLLSIENMLSAHCSMSSLIVFDPRNELQKIKQNYPLKQKQNMESYYLVLTGLEFPI